MIITHKLEMDMQRQGEPDVIRAVQGDTNTRVLELSLYSGGEPWQIPAEAQVWMRYCKSDGVRGVYDTLPDGEAAWTLEGNVLRVTLAPQMLTVPGMVLAQVELIQDVATLATFAFRIGVERNVAAGAPRSEDYVNMLQWMKGELDRLLEEARDSGEFDGPQGPQGDAGISIVDFAAQAGFTGTEEELGRLLTTPCLPLKGGTMEGPVDMGGHTLGNLASPVNDTDAVTKRYLNNMRSCVKIVFSANGWSDEPPYEQQVTITTVVESDLLILEPDYIRDLTADRTTKAAFDCVSYFMPGNRKIIGVCLDEKPQTDLRVWVYSLH